MFSGIVRGVGRIVAQHDAGGDRRVTIRYDGAAMDRPAAGASIAVNGVCLTATASDAACFTADVSAATLSVTTLGALGVGADVNLEPALMLGERLDGHLVTGHVDGVGHVVTVGRAARSVTLTIEIPQQLRRYVARKGSVAVDGVSLTVNAVAGARFEVNIVPHTLDTTLIPGYRPGTAVNIEIDVVARYVERLLATTDSTTTALDREFLESHGYTSRD